MASNKFHHFKFHHIYYSKGKQYIYAFAFTDSTVLLWHYRIKPTILGVKFVHLQNISELAFQKEYIDQLSHSH